VELGELVGVGVPNVAEDKKCPFSHDPLKGDEENELGGIGSKLAENMKVAKGICHESRPAGEFRKGSEDPDPRDRKKPVRDVVIEIDGEPIRLNDGSSDPLLYPVTCAAHHLIPAQESLKGHPVLEFMCWNGKDQDFRSGKAKDPQPVESLLWGNVAYNVNGCQNGVWLPGNYAVGGGKGGVKIWAEEGETKKRGPAKNKLWSEKVDLAADDWDSGDDDKEEEKVDAMTRLLNASSPADFMLSGTNYEISELNPKWAYVKASMDAIKAQFHDRHEDYSKEVKDYLDKVHAAYENMHAKFFDTCKDCEKARKREKAKDDEVGPPFGILGRLNTGAEFFKRYLRATGAKLGAKKTKRAKKVTTAKNIFTSDWCAAWFLYPVKLTEATKKTLHK